MECIATVGTASTDFVRSYMGVNYRRHYAALLRQHPAPPEAIAELCLFRFWLACRAHRHARDAQATDAPPLHLPPAWPLPRHAAGFDIEYTLGAWFDHLLQSRFDLYDRFFRLGRSDDDPLGLGAAALALSCQLFVQPAPAMRVGLRAEAHALFAMLVGSGAPAREDA